MSTSLSRLLSFHQPSLDEPRANRAHRIRAIGKVWLEVLTISTVPRISHVCLTICPSNQKAQDDRDQKGDTSLPYSVVVDLTNFRVSLRSSGHTTVPFIAMKPWQCTCSDKHRPMPTQVCATSAGRRSAPLTPASARLDPNERRSNVGHLRYSGRRWGRVRREPEEVRPPPTRFRGGFRSWVPNEAFIRRADLQVCSPPCLALRPKLIKAQALRPRDHRKSVPATARRSYG
jgi:hypothetical protein